MCFLRVVFMQSNKEIATFLGPRKCHLATLLLSSLFCYKTSKAINRINLNVIPSPPLLPPSYSWYVLDRPEEPQGCEVLRAGGLQRKVCPRVRQLHLQGQLQVGQHQGGRRFFFIGNKTIKQATISILRHTQQAAFGGKCLAESLRAAPLRRGPRRHHLRHLRPEEGPVFLPAPLRSNWWVQTHFFSNTLLVTAQL